MAKLPPLKKLYDKDIEGAAAWAKKLLIVINSFFQHTSEALNKNLTFQDNILSQIVDLDYIGGTAVTLSTKLRQPLTGMLVLQVSGLTITGAVQPIWMQIEQRIEITSFTGLTTGNQYKIRLLFI